MTSSPLNDETPLPPPTEIEEAALAWFARCQRGLTAEQETAFQTWLTADPRHAELFNELDGTWALLGRAGSLAPATMTLVPPTRARWLRPLVYWGFSVAAAVALTITYITWWRPAHYTGETATAIGALHIIHLPDGSVVTLNTDSAIATIFTPGERRVKLERGEAHFAVAKNAARPFIVEAGGVAVRAVGTAFNVHLEDKGVEVLVTEGKVRVDDAMSGKSLLAQPVDLNAAALPGMGNPVLASGQKVVVALPAPVPRVENHLAEAAATAVSSEEMQRKLAWQHRRMDFELATLGEIVADFNRYNTHKLIIGDPALAERRFGGSFRPDDQAGFVRILQENFGVTVRETDAATILYAGR